MVSMPCQRCFSYLHRLLLGAFVLFAVAVSPAQGDAMTVLAVDLPQLVLHSHTIVRGSVVHVGNVVLDEKGHVLAPKEVAARTSPDAEPIGLRAFTDVSISVYQPYKGGLNRGATLTFRMVGGRIGGFTVAVPGMPGFSQGEEVFLFLEKTSAGLTPTGAMQGVFRIHRTDVGNAVADHDLGGVQIFRTDIFPKSCTGGNLASPECLPHTARGLPAIPQRMPLSTLDALVRSLLGMPSAAPGLVPAPGLRSR